MVFLVLIGAALAVLLTRAAAPRWVLIAVLGLMALYTVLKLTGVIEASAPARTGVS